MDGKCLRYIAAGKSPRTVLLVSRFEQDRVTLSAILNRARLKLYTAISVSEAIAILLDESIPVVICGGHMLGGDWRALWSSLRFLADRPNLIVSSAQADKLLWDEVHGLGGYTVVPARFDAATALPAIQLARSNWLRQTHKSGSQHEASVGVLPNPLEVTLTRLTAWARNIGLQRLSLQRSRRAAMELEERAIERERAQQIQQVCAPE